MKKISIRGAIIPNSYKRVYDYFDIESCCPQDIDLGGEDEEVEIDINSCGGDVMAGAEIYTAIQAHKGKVTVTISGLAASMASVIAMAGDHVRISPVARMMIHNVSSYAVGDYRDMEHEAQRLKTANASIINAYSLKTGKTQQELQALMDEEKWMSAGEAKELGFADEVIVTEQAEQNRRLVAASAGIIPEAVINKFFNREAEEAKQKAKARLEELARKGTK